ncbi:MAG TPA: cyclic peptide export ABC transporter [Pyrinomonadaceae bacterium]|jgi:putative ATP-binding cassette transporter
MALITFLLRSSRLMILLSILVGIVSGISSAALIALIHRALSMEAATAASLVWAFVGLGLVRFVSGVASEVFLIYLAQNAVFKLRLQLSRRILATSLRHLEELDAHRLLASLIDDVTAISVALINVPILCINIVVILGCLIYLGWLAWTVLLAVLYLMAFGIITYQLVSAKGMHHLRLAREHWDQLVSHFHGLIEGTKELKLHRQRRAAFLSKLLEQTAARLRRHNIAGMSIYVMAGSWGNLLFFVLVGLLLFGLPDLRDFNRQTLTGYVLVLLYMMAPLSMTLNVLPQLARANVALKKLETLGLTLAAHATDELSGRFDVPSRKWNRLEMLGVTHSYRSEQDESSFELGPIDLSFRPGELIFLIGGNGSGKTTLAKLLTGLYVPESGEIYLDDQPINEENREAYRQHFSAIFTDFYLFESLLGLDCPELDLAAQQYLEKLQLNHKVQVTDGQFSTTALSNGQRKRLALLAAYLEDRPFYIFDEWAADQDPHFKEIFYETLLPELKSRGKTVLVLSHDEKYYHVADRIIKLDYGKLVSSQPVGAYAPKSQSRTGELPALPLI